MWCWIMPEEREFTCWSYEAFGIRLQFLDNIPKSLIKQVSHRDWKTWKMKMVMEKPWNMKNWPKVIDFVISHGILLILPPELSGREMVMENHKMVMEKYFVKSVGTL